jgi:uncharacterized protein YlxW (UPF0749 family)
VGRRGGAPAFVLAISALIASGAYSQDKTPESAREMEKVERQRELDILRGDLERRQAAETKLKSEVEALKSDRHASRGNRPGAER